MNYKLRTKDQLIEDLKILTHKKTQLTNEYKAAMKDIISDATIIKLEIELLQSLGVYK